MGFFSSLLSQKRAVGLPENWRPIHAAITKSGVSVTPMAAMQYSAVHSCVRVLSESVASLPLILYERKEDGRARATDHNLYPLLSSLPNPELTSYELIELLMVHVTLWGNAYCEIQRTNGGQVAALWPLRPDRIEVKRQAGQLIYQYQMPGVPPLPAHKVWHIRGLGFDGMKGY